MKGQLAEEYRLPLVAMTPANRAILQKTMRDCGLLE
jgi:hypothetical protein